MRIEEENKKQFEMFDHVKFEKLFVRDVMYKPFHFLLEGEASWIHSTERRNSHIYARVGPWVSSVVQFLEITMWLKWNDVHMMFFFLLISGEMSLKQDSPTKGILFFWMAYV